MPESFAPESLTGIEKWAQQTFGHVTVVRAAIRANEEMAELLREAEIYMEQEEFSLEQSDKIMSEAADVAIVLCQVACVLERSLQAAIDKKMRINRNRKWRHDGTGCAYHVKEEGA